MSNTKKLEDLSITEINSEICIRLETVLQFQDELIQLRSRRKFLQDNPPLEVIKSDDVK